MLLARKILGGPLPRAQRPRSGRALSRGQRRPRDQAAFGVSAHSRNDPSRDAAGRPHAANPEAFALRIPIDSPSYALHWCSFSCSQLKVRADVSRWRSSSLSHRVSPPARHFVLSSPGRPSPPSMVRRCGSRRLRGNPPAAGPPLRCGPARRKRRLGASGAWAAAIPRTPAGE